MVRSNVHPMESQEYAVFTPSIDSFFHIIRDWLHHKITGGYVYGVPRIGKSRAIKFWLAYLIKEECINCALFRVIYSRSIQPSWTHFYDELLSSEDMGGSALSGNKSLKRNKIINRLSLLAKATGGNQILFIIDEAQNLSIFDYKCFCDLQSRLDNIGFRVTFVYVGSYELNILHKNFRSVNDLQIVGRFSLNNYRFRGVCSQNELNYVLTGYDEDSEWPENSSNSYTRYFYTRAFDAGSRLIDSCEIIWSSFIKLTPGERDSPEIPMEHVAKSVEYLFREHSDTSAIQIQFTIEQIEVAIKSTRYPEYAMGTMCE